MDYGKCNAMRCVIPALKLKALVTLNNCCAGNIANLNSTRWRFLPSQLSSFLVVIQIFS
jgi:hypothetical protein